MDWARLGLVIRALRRRRGWRQTDLAAAAGVSQALISLIERGHGERVAARTLARIAAALDARFVVDIRWRGGDLDRLLDQDHATILGLMVERLEAVGWAIRVELSYATYRSSGSIDILAWHAKSRALLVVEIKTEVTSGEATLRKLDEKTRLAGEIARDRFGWDPASVSRLLVMEDTTTARSRVSRSSALFDAALPLRAIGFRRWLAEPRGSVSALVFLPPSIRGSRMSCRGGRHRVRIAR